MSQWTVDTLKEHVDAILDERKTALDAALSAAKEADRKADERLDRILQGFPQEYSRKEDLETLEREIRAIRLDHVQRHEFDTLKDTQTQSRGARLALSATAGIILTLIAVTLSVMYAHQLSHRDISQQIAIESPWANDRPGIEKEISDLEHQVLALKTQLALHEAEDRIIIAKNSKK